MSKKPKFEEIPRTMQRPAQGQAKITSRGAHHAMSIVSKPGPSKPPKVDPPPLPKAPFHYTGWNNFLEHLAHERMERRFGR